MTAASPSLAIVLALTAAGCGGTPDRLGPFPSEPSAPVDVQRVDSIEAECARREQQQREAWRRYRESLADPGSDVVADERVARCAEPPELVVAARTPHARALYTADAYEGRCALAFEVGGQWFLSASFLCRAVSYPSHVVGVRPHVHQQLDELSLTESSSGAVLRYAVRGDDTEITYGEIACTWASAEPRCERSGGAALY